MNNFTLINGDCLEELPKLIDDGIKVDLVLTDPPYGTIKNLNLDGWNNKTSQWDSRIPTNELFKYCEKMLRMNGKLILFSQEPYTSYLRQYKAENMLFNYPLIWEKDHFANSLFSKKAPVSYFEDLSVWTKKHDSDNTHPLRKYAQKLLNELNVSYKDIEKKLGHRKAEHFFYGYNSSQFSLCTETTYNELINVYNINKLECFKPYEELKSINESFNPTFNLSNKKVKSNIFKYKKSYEHNHPTEKPVDLLEDLIKTYTNDGDTVLDFTMGSGSTGVACANTNRNFIGIELDKKYFNIAKERISGDNNG